MDMNTLPVVRIAGTNRKETQAVVASEFPLTVFLNDVELVTLLCSPSDLDNLAVGFLFAEGFLKSKDDIKNLTVNERTGIVRVTRHGEFDLSRELLFKRLITSACGRGAAFYSTADAQNLTKIDSGITISSRRVFNLLDKFNRRSELFKTSGGVHSAALADGDDILIFKDDLGRHNAIDKVFGECLLKEIPTEERILITSGRAPSEMILKAAKGKVPILVAVGSTTDLGVRLADNLGVTLVGFARGKDMTIYTHGWRIADEQAPAKKGGRLENGKTANK
ncbi:MAG: formate dehydrogenase accessory sulfurtransferase FdhD [Dehalococcoidales bacterium]|nr:formate dehydrogenase accessory sulfurtransferase FdhD [Dehalococcoidales bacterium]